MLTIEHTLPIQPGLVSTSGTGKQQFQYQLWHRRNDLGLAQHWIVGGKTPLASILLRIKIVKSNTKGTGPQVSRSCNNDD